MKRSSAITLVLVGTATALLGYTATHHDGDNDIDSWDSTTQPSSHHSGSTYHGSRGYWYTGSGSRSSGGTSSGSHGGTSRGGFGGSGHAAGS